MCALAGPTTTGEDLIGDIESRDASARENRVPVLPARANIGELECPCHGFGSRSNASLSNLATSSGCTGRSAAVLRPLNSM